jgi:hypothetical protein
MSKYINLFSKKNQSVIISSGIKKTKTLSFRAILILIAILSAIYALKYLLNHETDKIEKKIALYESYVTNNKKLEKEIVKMDFKKNALKKAIKNDVNFLPYYKAINNLITENASKSAEKVATPSSLIMSINFDKERSSTITFYSKDYKAHLKLIKLLESEKSLNLFESMSINGNIYLKEKQQTGYILNTQVKFKKIKNENI